MKCGTLRVARGAVPLNCLIYGCVYHYANRCSSEPGRIILLRASSSRIGVRNTFSGSYYGGSQMFSSLNELNELPFIKQNQRDLRRVRLLNKVVRSAQEIIGLMNESSSINQSITFIAHTIIQSTCIEHINIVLNTANH